MRIPLAATELIETVGDLTDDVSCETRGDADGFGVHRTIAFLNVGFPLADAIRACEDERITEVDEDEDTVYVTFVADSRADFTGPFPIEDALEVLLAE